jgi:hypothetical protein
LSTHDPKHVPEKLLDRRSVMIAAAAASGVALAKLAAPDDAKASHDTNIAYDSQTVMHTDVVNTTSSSTRISTNITGTSPFVVLNGYPVGISRPDGMLGRTAHTTSNCAGVAGACEAADGGIGVIGTVNNATGAGVFGYCGSSVPFQAPPAGTGVYGEGPQRGISGKTATGVAVHGVATGDGLAAHFEGVVEAVGAVPATVLQGSDGLPRRTYAHHSLSPVLEHIGQATLVDGKAKVNLPEAFDVLVPSKHYQVFLTEYGDRGGLYVSARNLHSFVVRSRRAGANGPFGYRVVSIRTDLENG